MKPTNLIIASVVLAALAGAIYWAQKHPGTGTSDSTPAPLAKLADISPAQVQGVQITRRDGSSLSVQRQNGKWMISEPQAYTADQDAVSAMISPLNPLTPDSVIEETSSDLAKYGLDKPAVSASIQERGKTQQLQIGNDIPTTSLVYARWGTSPRIYALNSTVKSSLDKSVNDLRDKRLLTIDSGKLTQLGLASPKGTLEFSRVAQGDWQMQKPQRYRVDSFAVEELVRKLSDAKMDLTVSPEDQGKAKAAFAGGQPIATVKLSANAATQTLDIRKNKEDYYAFSSVVPGVFKINSDLGQAVDKGVDDFRNKKLFDFAFSDPDKFQIDLKTYVRAGVDWKQNGQTIDAGSVQNFLDKLREMSATKFDPAGFTQAVATVMVQSNGYKRTETVEFAKNADGYLARRAGDPSLYQLDGKSVDDMLNAGKAIKPATKK